MVGVFAIAIAVGTALLMLPVMRPGGVGAGLSQALFTSTSAVTVTGLAVVDTETGWSRGGQVVILLLIQVGGLGITTLGTLVVMAVSRRLGIRTRLLTQAESPWLAVGDVRRVLLGVLTVTVVGETVIASVLSLRWWLGYGYDLGTSLWLGAFHSVSAFNNAGFALFSDSLTRFAGDPVILVTVSAAIVLGGLGFPVVFELWGRWIARRPSPAGWTLHLRLTVVWSGVLLVGGWLMVTLFEWDNPATFGDQSVGWRLLNGFFASVSPRTAGFNTVDYGQATDSTLLTTDLLMFVGGGSASTAGGIKVTTFAVVLLTVVAAVRGTRDVVAFNRRVPAVAQRTAVTVTLVSLAAVAVSVYVLLAVTPFGLEDTLFEAISALATVGLSTGITPQLPVAAEYVLVVLMFVGRVGVLTMASAFALGDRDTPYRLPEERPIVG